MDYSGMSWIEQQLSVIESRIVIGKEMPEVKLAEALASVRALSNTLCIQRRQQEENQMVAEAVTHFNGLSKTIVTDKGYTPSCPYGYDDCVLDPIYIKFYHPKWYEDLGSPTSCNECKDGSEYDDEDK
jgi:hypothetical protein